MTDASELPYKDRIRAKRRAPERDPSIPRPMVVWRRRGCREILLSVYLRPSGWHVVAEDFEQIAPEWLERTGLESSLLDQHRSGEAFIPNLRKVRGQRFPVLPHSVDEWPDGLSYEVGCPHAVYVRSLSYLAEQCRRVAETHERVEDLLD